MKAALLKNSSRFVIHEIDKPVPQAKEVLLKVEAVSICDSDILRVKSEKLHNIPTVMGNEFSGIVEAVGNEVKEINEGDRVAAIPFLPCGQCEDCQSKNYHWCDHGQKIGQEKNGAFAEYVAVPEENVLNTDRLSFEEAALLEPLAKAAHGIKALNIQPDDSVTVFGLDTFGLLNAQWLRQAGVKQIIGLDADKHKLQEAKKHGVTHTIDLLHESVEERIFELTQRRGTDVAIECLGSAIAEELCLLVTKKGGTIGYYGLAPSNMMLRQQAFENIFRREYTIKGLWNTYSAPFPGKEWHESIALIKNKQLDPATLISHRFALDDIQQAFDLAMDEEITSWKILLLPECS